MESFEQHPHANFVPPMSDAQFAELRADIEKNGQIEPIVMFEGKVLEGWHRYRACRELKLAVKSESFLELDCSSEIHPVLYVAAKNLKRRHLTDRQRRQIIIPVIAVDPEKPDAQIAKEVGINNHTVAKARKEGEDIGAIAKVKTRRDSMGRQRKTRKTSGGRPRKSKRREKDGSTVGGSKTEARLNSLIWSNATPQQRTKFLDAIGFDAWWLSAPEEFRRKAKAL